MMNFFFNLIVAPFSQNPFALMGNICFMIGYALMFYNEVTGEDPKDVADTGSTGSSLKL